MTISIAEAVLEGANLLRRAGVPEARREAGSLLAHALGCDRTFIITNADHPLDGTELESFRTFVELRSEGKPLQYITGRQEFFGLEFEVTNDVLIPRPETEHLVEAALELVQRDSSITICDVGTGSGCIVVTLLKQLPQASALAVDISEAALQLAKKNAERHGVFERVEFLVSDCLANVGQDRIFDLIVSNPPYVAEGALTGLQREVRDYEPRIALQAGTDGLDIVRRLLSEAQHFVRPGGHLLLEIGFDQHEAVGKLIHPDIWKLLDIHQDLQGIPRVVALERLAVATSA